MFACGVPVLPKIISRKAVLIQGGIRPAQHTSVGIWRGKRAVVGDTLEGSMEEKGSLGLDPVGQ